MKGIALSILLPILFLILAVIWWRTLKRGNLLLNGLCVLAIVLVAAFVSWMLADVESAYLRDGVEQLVEDLNDLGQQDAAALQTETRLISEDLQSGMSVGQAINRSNARKRERVQASLQVPP